MGLSRKAVLCALVLGLFGCVTARSLSQSGATCEAASFLEILVTEGSCSGQAEVTCSAFASSESDVKIAIEEWYAEDYAFLCVSERIDAAARAVGRAVARLYADALVKVSCTSASAGSACGWSVGRGNAWAVATAKAVAIAAVDLGPDRAICEADITALSGVFVDVAGSVSAAACQSGEGSQSQNEDLYVESVRSAIADAFAWASAEFCNLGPAVIANSKCQGTATSGSEGTDTGDGASSGTQSVCTGSGAAKCCPSRFRFSNCNCLNCNGPWEKVQDNADGLRVWKDQEDNFCFCQ